MGESRSQRHSKCEKDLMCSPGLKDAEASEKEHRCLKELREACSSQTYNCKELNAAENRKALGRGPWVLGENTADGYLDFSLVRRPRETSYATRDF